MLLHLPLELSAMTYEEAMHLRDAGAVALLPTGATEAHGPHLPLGTDVVIACEAARRTCLHLRERGKAAVVLPPLAYAVTEFAAGFAGTLSIPAEAARSWIFETVVAATRSGFSLVVVCNAHFEPRQIACIRAAVDEARAQGGRVTFPDVTRRIYAARLGDEFRSGACHAGRYETSLVLAAAPHLVHGDKASALPPNPTSLVDAIRAGQTTFEGAGGPQAYFGWPHEATVAEGERLYAVLVAIFSDAALG